eukprot:1133890-Pyramimonas_sp.AAC.1
MKTPNAVPSASTAAPPPQQLQTQMNLPRRSGQQGVRRLWAAWAKTARMMGEGEEEDEEGKEDKGSPPPSWTHRAPPANAG